VQITKKTKKKIPNYKHKYIFLGLPKPRLIVNGNYDKPEFGQPQEDILMFIIWNYFFGFFGYLH